MRSERGQASVEWIALVLLLTLGLTALARFAPRADAGDLAPELLHALTCTARGGCAAGAGGDAPAADAPAGHTPAGQPPGARAPDPLITAPPLVPLAPGERGAPSPRPRALPAPGALPAPRGLPAPLVRGRALFGRAGRGVGVLWRRSWLLCLGYERVRYSVLHPEIRFPHQTIPVSEDLRIANDCLSPVDLVRDFGPRAKP
jgi:hypothetical protein